METIAAVWEQLIDNETAEQLAEQVQQEDLQVLVVKEEINKFPTKEKISKGTELKQLQDKARTLHYQESMHNKETVEKEAKAERVTGLLHLVQKKINEFTQALANTSLKHPSAGRVQELEQ